MEATAQPNLATKIVVSIVLWGAIIGAIIFGAMWLVEHDQARERGWKQDCVDRGGSVTEHVGGFSRFDCVNPKSFR